MMNHYDIDWLTKRFDKGDYLEYLFFWGHTKGRNQEVGNYCFSQWYDCSFDINGKTYKSTEHWMMAHKAQLFENYELMEKIIDSDNPSKAKELGRQVINFDEQTWIKHRYEIVKLGNIHKFNQNRNLGDYLIETGNKILVEASPVDTIWGIGLTKESQDIDNIYTWRGLNLLGFALMEVRDFLKDFGYFDQLTTDLVPPWIKFPDAANDDMFWRMGAGEYYIMEFFKVYSNLNYREKQIYRLTNPEPFNWSGFYEE